MSFQSGATLVKQLDRKTKYKLIDSELLLNKQFFYDLESHLVLRASEGVSSSQVKPVSRQVKPEEDIIDLTM